MRGSGVGVGEGLFSEEGRLQGERDRHVRAAETVGEKGEADRGRARSKGHQSQVTTKKMMIYNCKGDRKEQDKFFFLFLRRYRSFFFFRAIAKRRQIEATAELIGWTKESTEAVAAPLQVDVEEKSQVVIGYEAEYAQRFPGFSRSLQRIKLMRWRFSLATMTRQLLEMVK